jgi:Domain of unknown function (DUF4331)
MSHHFDTPTALEDPRINVCDFYLFEGRGGNTVMAMTVNPDAGISSPDTFREEGLYAFRFDLDSDGREELSFKVQFGNVSHGAGDEHRHVQAFQVRRARGAASSQGADGELLVEGHTGEVVAGTNGVNAFAGLSPDLFAGDAAALGAFRNAFFNENRFDPAAFRNRKNFFARRNVTAIVLEVPNTLVGQGTVRAWATASLFGHAPEIQVSRWGLPLVTNIFMPDPEMKERFNRTGPADDQTPFVTQVGQVVERLVGLAGSSARPADYAKRVTDRLFPTVLPYELGSSATFAFTGFNGRALADDVMDVILTLATNTALGDGVAPDKSRILDVFPYFGKAYSPAEQVDVAPAGPRRDRK